MGSLRKKLEVGTRYAGIHVHRCQYSFNVCTWNMRRDVKTKQKCVYFQRWLSGLKVIKAFSWYVKKVYAKIWTIWTAFGAVVLHRLKFLRYKSDSATTNESQSVCIPKNTCIHCFWVLRGTVSAPWREHSAVLTVFSRVRRSVDKSIFILSFSLRHLLPHCLISSQSGSLCISW